MTTNQANGPKLNPSPSPNGYDDAAPRTAENQYECSPAARSVPMDPLLYTYREAAARLRMSESWLRKQGARGAVPTVPFGRAVRFGEAELQEIIRARRRPARPAAGRRSKL
jgi:hypothetical protein